MIDQATLNAYGHVHVRLDDGTEFGLSAHDVTITGGTVVVNSDRGYWEFETGRIVFLDKEPSGPV